MQYSVFSGYIFPKWILSQMFQSPDPAACPPLRPSACHGSQVMKLVRFPGFPSSQVIKLVRVPVFPGSQVIEVARVPILAPGTQKLGP